MSKIGNYIIGLNEGHEDYDKSEQDEFTTAWDRHAVVWGQQTVSESPFIACPECNKSDHVGKVEREEFKMIAGIYEPISKWVECDNCNGLGEIQADIKENDDD
tara:strand:- start:2073 stop:2381 length:309 start_codon:yes stop_codon:yes gene_type:complete